MTPTEREKEFQRYLSTYNGRRLTGRLKENGVWKVTGEDPNCDLGGYHHNPELGVFEGVLEDVIRHAVGLAGFWQWGGGGDFEKVKIKAPIKIDPDANLSLRIAIENRVKDLVSNFLYYNRKEDEELPVGAIDKAVTDGVITAKEITKIFETELGNGLQKD